MLRRENVALELCSRQAGRKRLPSQNRAKNSSALTTPIDCSSTYTSITQHGVDQER